MTSIFCIPLSSFLNESILSKVKVGNLKVVFCKKYCGKCHEKLESKTAQLWHVCDFISAPS